jgi:hypothetical protein
VFSLSVLKGISSFAITDGVTLSVMLELGRIFEMYGTMHIAAE